MVIYSGRPDFHSCILYGFTVWFSSSFWIIVSEHKDHCSHFHCSDWWSLVSECFVRKLLNSASCEILEVIPNGKRLIDDSIGHSFITIIIFETIWLLLDWYKPRLHIITCEWRMAMHNEIIHVRASLSFHSLRVSLQIYVFFSGSFIVTRKTTSWKCCSGLFFSFSYEIHFPTSSASRCNRFSPSFIDRRVAAITDLIRIAWFLFFAHKKLLE